MANMTIEKVLLSKNRSAFERIVKMFQSLIIKNQVEAENNDTAESQEAYSAYEGAYEEADSVLSYDLTEYDLMKAGFTPTETLKFIHNPNALQNLINSKTDKRAINYIAGLRAERIKNYIELNAYYRPFMGLPINEEEIIKIDNLDKAFPGQNDYINLHEITFAEYPKTYNRLYVERDIDIIYGKYNYLYLKYLEKPLSPYVIHNKGQYEICYYDAGILQGNELQCFFESYNVAREEILYFDYIEPFEKTYDAYVDIMFLFILYYTFTLYCCKSLQRYAARDYTDDEIYDILDSNNLSVLKTLNMGLLKNVIAALPDLKTHIGTRHVIDIIFDIVADNSISMKEYYLEKKYLTDANGNISINHNETYDKNVDLVFVESTIRKGENSMFSPDQELSYETVTGGDDTWGGTQDITDDEVKQQIKRDIKLELLQKDFSTILTKYISITKIVDMYNKVLSLTNKLGIFYQLNENRDNFLKDHKAIYKGFDVTALSLYAAWCLIFATMHGVTDPDYIVQDASEIEDVLYLRKSEQLSDAALAAQTIEIDCGNGFKRTLGDYLTAEEINRYLVSFNFTDATTVSDVLKQYEANYEIIKAIDEKINNTSNYDEYEVWSTIKKANMISKNITNLFQGFTLYSECIKDRDGDFWKYLEPIITNREPGYLKALKEECTAIQETYRDYIKNLSQGQIILAVDEKEIAGGERIEEVGLLFNEFMSYYTQLYKQNFSVGHDDPNNNALFLLYSKVSEKIMTESTENLILAFDIIKDKITSYGDMAYLELLHYIIDRLKTEDRLDLVLEMDQISQLLKSVHIEQPSFSYIRVSEKQKSDQSLDLSLTEVVNL
jgi:hypothetical protein